MPTAAATNLLIALCAAGLLLPACRAPRGPAAADPARAEAPAPGAAFVTPDGLLIHDTRAGDGAPCPPDATVEILFTASFPDGTVFDSSEKRRRTLTIDLSSVSVIRGLREGIPGMRPGGRRTLRIPWRMAYGEHGRDPIPPRTDLIFDIELVRTLDR